MTTHNTPTPTPTNTTLRSTALGVGVIAAALLLGACGSDDAADASAPKTVEITTVDYAFVDVPRTVRAGSALTVHNDSTEEVHEVVAVRLPDDEPRSAAELAQLPMEELEPLFAGLETVIVAAPGDDGTAVVGDGTLQTPGRYLLLCIIPTGADPEEYLDQSANGDGPPEVDGGPPHFAHGMFAELTVES